MVSRKTAPPKCFLTTSKKSSSKKQLQMCTRMILEARNWLDTLGIKTQGPTHARQVLLLPWPTNIHSGWFYGAEQ